jgi:hypothetical protein
MASYTKQAKDESLQYLAMRARAIRAGAIRTKECRVSCAPGGEPVTTPIQCRKPRVQRVSRTVADIRRALRRTSKSGEGNGGA